MKTITIASCKGGSLKTSLTAALAVRATQDSGKVAMIDLNDDQGSLEMWWSLRGRPAQPHLDETSLPLAQSVKALSTTYDWLFIDTPPYNMPLIEDAIEVADAVLIPVRGGFFDIMAAQDTVAMCRKYSRPYSFVLVAVNGHHKMVLQQAIVAIERAGLGPICATRIGDRQSWVVALTKAKTGPELDRKAQAEIGELWGEVQELARKGGGQ